MNREAPREAAILAAMDPAGRVLLVRQARGPFAGEWLLPGGGLRPYESSRQAVAREVWEETGLEVTAATRVQRYEVRSLDPSGFHFHVHLFRGTAGGAPWTGAAGEVRWADPTRSDAHPVVVRELADAGVIEAGRDAIRRALRERGVRMTALGLSDDDRAWYEEVRGTLEEAYLSADDPAAQSGKGGGMKRWTLGRRPIARAVDRDGTFLDVGCANGLLMETLTRWALQAGHRIEPYGLELSERIARLARVRYPRWADRVHVGNALTWRPPRRFDLVRTELEYVPRYRAPELVARLVGEVVAPRGRLIVCGYGTDVAERVGDTLRGWGYQVAGELEGQDHEGRVLLRVGWIDAA